MYANLLGNVGTIVTPTLAAAEHGYKPQRPAASDVLCEVCSTGSEIRHIHHSFPHLDEDKSVYLVPLIAAASKVLYGPL